MFAARSSLRRAAVPLIVTAGGTSCILAASQKSHTQGMHLHSEEELLVPTLQALSRAARLAKTAALMAIDYKTADWRWMYSTEVESESNESRYWQDELERCQGALEEAQAVYASSNDSHLNQLDPTQRLEIKKQQKEQMNAAAQALAQAEHQVRTLGTRKSKLHFKAAQRLLHLCQENRGVYIKIGQHLANLDYLLPAEYIQVLSALYDDNPTTPFAEVRQVIQQDLGKDPNELFESIDPTPIASASLAQVHVAYEKGTGKKLAVKVQHFGLRETSVGDTFALVTAVRIAERVFEGFTWGWLADEIAPQLPKELDFLNEGRNSQRAAASINRTGLDCVIPKVLWKYSSPRVLTMEFEEGFKATDLDAMEEAGLSKHDVARLISSVFSSQVFLSGWVHCDPHPANVLLRRNKEGKPQMVLVDHGLYRELDRDFRRQYASLWKNLMLADLAGIQAACHNLGVDQAYTLFAAMLTARPFDEIIERSKTGSLHSQAKPDSSADRAVIRGYAQRFIQDIFDLLGTIPRQMLLLLKMNDCLRHIDYALGSPANTLIVSGKYAAISLYKEESLEASNWVERLRVWLSYMGIAFRIQLYETGTWINNHIHRSLLY